MAYTFLTDCIHSTAEKIIALTDSGKRITWETFKKYVPVEEVKSVFPYYSYRGETYNSDGDLTCPMHIKDDYAVGFWKGVYDGQSCYYITHSAIEYIFVEEQ